MASLVMSRDYALMHGEWGFWIGGSKRKVKVFLDKCNYFIKLSYSHSLLLSTGLPIPYN
jgi:hypothetical protein